MAPSSRPLYQRESYATDRAIDGALSRGLDLSLADWRGVFLAITDTMAQDGVHGAGGHVAAAYIGPVRDAERWAITWRGRRFDALYDPGRPMVTGVTGPREPIAADVPTRPLPLPSPAAIVAR